MRFIGFGYCITASSHNNLLRLCFSKGTLERPGLHSHAGAWKQQNMASPYLRQERFKSKITDDSLANINEPPAPTVFKSLGGNANTSSIV